MILQSTETGTDCSHSTRRWTVQFPSLSAQTPFELMKEHSGEWSGSWVNNSGVKCGSLTKKGILRVRKKEVKADFKRLSLLGRDGDRHLF